MVCRPNLLFTKIYDIINCKEKKGNEAVKRKKNKSTNINDLARAIRRDWNGINPVTRIVESKKNKPIKHKKREMERANEV